MQHTLGIFVHSYSFKAPHLLIKPALQLIPLCLLPDNNLS